MRGKANLLGHSLHPMLIVFPLGLLSLAWIFDTVHLATGNGLWAQVAFWMLTCGLIGGLVAAIPGLIDFFTLPANTRARRVGTRHLTVNLIAVAFFLGSWIVRLTVGIENAGAGSMILAIIGVPLVFVGGWYGGELVERLGVSVYPDAHLNASSSLKVEPLLSKDQGPRETRPVFGYGGPGEVPPKSPSPREPLPA